MNPRRGPGPSSANSAGLGDDDVVRDWSLSAKDVTEVMRARGTEHRLRFAVQLCALRATSRFVSDYQHVPIEAVSYLARQLGLTPVLFLSEADRPATETAQAARICQHLGYHEFDADSERRLRDRLQQATAEGATPAQLLALAGDLLRSGRIVLPAQSTLERLVASVAAHAIQDLFEGVATKLPDGFRDAIDDLVNVPEGEHRSPLSRFKEAPPAAKAPAIVASLARLDLLDSLLGSGVDLSHITPQLLQHLAQLGRRYDVLALKRFSAEKRYTLVTAFLVETQKTLLDQIIAAHDQYMTGLDRRARLAFDEKHRVLRRRAKSGMDTLIGAVDVFLSANRSAPISDLYNSLSEDALRDAMVNCRAFARLEEHGHTDELAARYGDLRKYFPAFLRLPFEAARGSEFLLTAIEAVRAVDGGASEGLLTTAPRQFIPMAWRKAAVGFTGEHPRRALWEIALAFAIRDALRSGDLFIATSRRHVSFWNLVMGDREWTDARQDAYTRLSIPARAADALGALRTAFGLAAGTATASLLSNPFATIQNGELRLRQPDALPITQQVRKLRAVFASSMPQVRIEDMLRQVDQWTGLTRALTPLGGYEPRGEDNYRTLLAAIIAHGTNLGVAAMSGSIEGMTPDQLQHASQWFLRETTLKAASKAIVDHHHRMSFSRVWGDGSLSSSDGQRFAVQRSSLLGAVYPRYFGYYDQAISLYTHTSDQLSVFATQVISCAPREASFVLDGLLENDTLLRPQIHTTDTHGFTEQLFGLCYMLGIAFMPRLKDLADQQLYKLDKEADHGPLDLLFRGTVDIGLISEQWDQLVRITASLKNRTAPAHVVLQRLINASPADRVSKALTALGRICKTIFILRYIADEPLRRMVQRQLNRGEARHALARWLFFANRGEFRTGDYEEIMNKASCLSLLSNAAVLWNTVQMARITQQLRDAGNDVTDDDLAHVWPLQRTRIIPNGTYFLNWPQAQPATMSVP